MVSEDEFKKKHDLPKDWKVETKEAEPEKKEHNVSSKMLWGLAVIVFIAAIAVFMLINTPEPGETQTLEIQGVMVTAPGDPYEWLAAVASRGDLVGKHLKVEKSKASSTILMEIGEVLSGRSSLASSGSGYDVIVGLSDRSGIFIEDDRMYIEGITEDELWEAAWLFSSIASSATIESDIALSQVDQLLVGKEHVAVIIDEEDACPEWSRISSALGNVNGAAGYHQAGSDFIFYQYLKNSECELQFQLPEDNTTESNITAELNLTLVDQTQVNQTQAAQESAETRLTLDSEGCPVPGDGTFVIYLERRDENKIAISGNELRIQYFDCASMVRLSLIVRDMLAPRLVAGLTSVTFPTYV